MKTLLQDERESIQSLIDYGATCELDATLAMQLMDYALAFDIPEVVSISLEQCLAPDFSFRGSVPGMWVADYYDAELCKAVLQEAGVDLIATPHWKFEKSDDREFSEAALVAVRQWEFIPGYLNGEPVKTRVRLPLSFTLRR